MPGQRPGTGPNPDRTGPGGIRHDVQRPSLGGRPGLDRRPGFNGRPEGPGRPGPDGVNRPGRGGWSGGGPGGRPGQNWNGQGWRGQGWNGRQGHFNRWSAFNRGWINGYWTGFNNGLWTGFGLGSFGFGGFGWGWPGFGLGGFGWGYGGFGHGLGFGGLGWGLPAWYFGSSCYNWGYWPYYNPYFQQQTVLVDVPVGVATEAVPFDYSVPINTEVAPQASASDEAEALFDQARALFKQQGYEPALQITDQALQKLPNDAALHEFRSLVLFALGRYNEAATGLYAVLAVGPGWNWATLIGLYPSVDVYTQQLRLLEDYLHRHRDSASAAFVLAYHYMTAGTPSHLKAAVKMLRTVVQLQPRDTIAPQLLAQLEKATGEAAPAPAAAAPPAVAPPAAEAPARTFPIEGSWTAKPNDETTITLKIEPGGRFTWVVSEKGQDRTIEGDSTHGNNLLTLSSSAGGVMVGKVTWTDETRFTFRLSAGPADDPGLSFTRSP